MSYASNTARYVDNEVLTRSPEWLVPLLYEHLIASFRRAIIQIEEQDLEGRSKSLNKAEAIIAELLCTLDRENGGEVAESLASLYAYFAVELLNARFSKEVGSLPKLVTLLEELHGAWVAAAEQVAPRTSAGRQLAAV
jgi:flagellar secretion chaperone FliS